MSRRRRPCSRWGSWRWCPGLCPRWSSDPSPPAFSSWWTAGSGTPAWTHHRVRYVQLDINLTLTVCKASRPSSSLAWPWSASSSRWRPRRARWLAPGTHQRVGCRGQHGSWPPLTCFISWGHGSTKSYSFSRILNGITLSFLEIIFSTVSFRVIFLTTF